VEPITSQRSLFDLRPTARLTVLALILWAIIDVLHTIIAVGNYEHRITVVTHGSADVGPAWLVYELLHHLMPGGLANTVAGRTWIAASLLAAATVITWLYQARRNAERAAPVSWWAIVLVTLLFHGLGRLYQIVTARGGAFAHTTLDTRWVAYPLWTAATVMTVLTAILTARMVRQITHAHSAFA
jgi:hypothetical protein